MANTQFQSFLAHYISSTAAPSSARRFQPLWSKLPNELLLKIAENLGFQDLHSLDECGERFGNVILDLYLQESGFRVTAEDKDIQEGKVSGVESALGLRRWWNSVRRRPLDVLKVVLCDCRRDTRMQLELMSGFFNTIDPSLCFFKAIIVEIKTEDYITAEAFCNFLSSTSRLGCRKFKISNGKCRDLEDCSISDSLILAEQICSKPLVHSAIAVERLDVDGTEGLLSLKCCKWTMTALTSLFLRRLCLSGTRLSQDILSNIFGTLRFPNLRSLILDDPIHINAIADFMLGHSGHLQQFVIKATPGSCKVISPGVVTFPNLDTFSAPLRLVENILWAGSRMPCLEKLKIELDGRIEDISSEELHNTVIRYYAQGIRELIVPVQLCPLLLQGAWKTKWLGDDAIETVGVQFPLQRPTNRLRFDARACSLWLKHFQVVELNVLGFPCVALLHLDFEDDNIDNIDEGTAAEAMRGVLDISEDVRLAVIFP